MGEGVAVKVGVGVAVDVGDVVGVAVDGMSDSGGGDAVESDAGESEQANDGAASARTILGRVDIRLKRTIIAPLPPIFDRHSRESGNPERRRAQRNSRKPMFGKRRVGLYGRLSFLTTLSSRPKIALSQFSRA